MLKPSPKAGSPDLTFSWSLLLTISLSPATNPLPLQRIPVWLDQRRDIFGQVFMKSTLTCTWDSSKFHLGCVFFDNPSAVLWRSVLILLSRFVHSFIPQEWAWGWCWNTKYCSTHEWIQQANNNPSSSGLIFYKLPPSFHSWHLKNFGISITVNIPVISHLFAEEGMEKSKPNYIMNHTENKQLVQYKKS